MNTTVAILLSTAAVVVVLVVGGWAIASWRERRRTDKFNRESADITEAEKQQRLNAKRRAES